MTVQCNNIQPAVFFLVNDRAFMLSNYYYFDCRYGPLVTSCSILYYFFLFGVASGRRAGVPST